MSIAMLSQNSLTAVVRNLRSASAGTEEEAVDQYIADTKVEVNNADPRVKIAAIQKATYFHMLGYSSQYAHFRVVEMMASPIFMYKRIAYLAACLTFTEDTDVIPLMTASLKRDLGSASQYEVGLALYCIASICTADMAQDVVADVVNLLNHPRSYVRKKATLSLYRIFLSYPESLRLTYGRLKEKLEDSNEKADTDPAVRGAVVCVLCELARRNPANFLGLAVPFYSLLSSVHSNWTLIKIVKVFGYFAPLEPRLGKKLVEPLTNLINTTGAKSVQYECLLAVANGMSRVASITNLSAEKIRTFVDDSDPNLKFLGLEALSLLVASSENKKLLADQREVVLRCLDDADSTIRLKALRVLHGLTTRRTMVAHINHMLDRCVRTPPDEKWSNAVIQAIIETAQTNDYEWVQDFEWYLGVLLDLCVVELNAYTHGGLMEQELVCILARVNAVRRVGVEEMARLLTDTRLLSADRTHSTQWRILSAAAFVCGEYPQWVLDITATCQSLLSEAVSLLPAEVQLACVGAVAKLAAYVKHPCARHVELRNGEEDCRMPDEPAPLAPPSIEELKHSVLFPEGNCASDGEGAGTGAAHRNRRECIGTATSTSHHPHRGLPRFSHSAHPSVLERAHLAQVQVLECPDVGPKFFDAELPPVAAGAQDAIEVPEDVDLDTPFCENVVELMALSGSDDEDGDEGGAHRNYTDTADEEMDANFNLEYRIEQQRRAEQTRREEMSAYYLRDDASPLRGGEAASVVSEGAVTKSAKDIGRGAAATPSPTSSSAHTRTRRPQKVHQINRELSKPTHYPAQTAVTAKASTRRCKTPEEEDEATKKLRGIDVTRALGVDERLPETLSYAQLIQQQLQQHGTPDKGMSSSRLDDALAPVPLYDKRPLRLTLTISGCKVRKDGFYLGCTLDCVNSSSSSTVHGVRLAVAPSETYETGAVRLHLSDVAPREGEEGMLEEGEATAVVVTDKLKGSAPVRLLVTLVLRDLPSTFIDNAVPFTLSWTADRRRHGATVALPLDYLYFTKQLLPALAPRSTEYVERIMAVDLAAAPIASTFLPCSKTAIMMAATASVPRLRLVPVDVFKDAMTLYGLLHGRKSRLSSTHVAVLLQEQEVEDTKGMLVTVRCHFPTLSEALILKLAAFVQEN